MPKIQTWNIRQGGGKRITAIKAVIQTHSADILVLTEYRNNGAGDALLECLHHAGYSFTQNTSSSSTQNSLLIASRIPPLGSSVTQELGRDSHRYLLTNFHNFDLVGCYFAQKEMKIPLWQYLIYYAKANANRPTLFIGDFNTGRHYKDEDGATFHCADYFERLSQTGWVDAWRHFAGDRREFSWYSRMGRGFRIDHAFISPPLVPSLLACYYSHSEREDRVSDHSSLLVELNFAS